MKFVQDSRLPSTLHRSLPFTTHLCALNLANPLKASRKAARFAKPRQHRNAGHMNASPSPIRRHNLLGFWHFMKNVRSGRSIGLVPSSESPTIITFRRSLAWETASGGNLLSGASWCGADRRIFGQSDARWVLPSEALPPESAPQKLSLGLGSYGLPLVGPFRWWGCAESHQRSCFSW